MFVWLKFESTSIVLHSDLMTRHTLKSYGIQIYFSKKKFKKNIFFLRFERRVSEMFCFCFLVYNFSIFLLWNLVAWSFFWYIHDNTFLNFVDVILLSLIFSLIFEFWNGSQINLFHCVCTTFKKCPEGQFQEYNHNNDPRYMS